mmetsp:Transcript_21068/g.54314  ORF Transcript_21068/g.54314 Transcript_21068/m.54314 type:complete len:208 (-) Transcript_21068:257-880(-)
MVCAADITPPAQHAQRCMRNTLQLTATRARRGLRFWSHQQRTPHPPSSSASCCAAHFPRLASASPSPSSARRARILHDAHTQTPSPRPPPQVIYYAFMDDAVNEHLIRHGVGKCAPRFVAESSCRYFKPLTYPNPVDIGLRVEHLGSSSVAYAIGIFDGGPAAARSGEEQHAAAAGTFVHVYVDEAGQPTPITSSVRTLLESLVVRD